MKKQTVIILSLAVIAMVAVNELVIKNDKASSKTAGAVVSTAKQKPTGKALIGGEFELVDQNGNKFTDKNLLGKYSLVYFGFTHCPMICPTALSNISLALAELGEDAQKFQTIFITADPERDTEARMKEWLQSFKGDIIGLTGSTEQTNKAAEKYKVYAQKLKPDSTGNYDMNHTSIIYLMDRNGEFITHFSHETPVETLVAALKKYE
jgi:protein SCO1/2